MKTLVIAPHPDDETLGVGGTLLRKKAEGETLAWLIMTSMSSKFGWRPESVLQREAEIFKIKEIYGFNSVFELDFPTTQLDQIPVIDLVTAVSKVLRDYDPDEIFVPHSSDIHSDHRITFDVVASCTKWFRAPSIKRVLAYETLSETDFGLDPTKRFQPNFFVNIEGHLEGKLRAINVYKSEINEFPFPRSNEAISALAALRGASSGFRAAEAFELLRERF
jgi:LmbE family N-acetylglucosaminyl deacetylase